MVDTPTPRPGTRPSGNAAGRYFFMAMLGLVVGIVATVMVSRALEARKNHYPEAVMQVMQAHVAALRDNVTANRCAATDTIPHLTTLRHLSNDLEPAFDGLRGDAAFVQHASGMRAAVDSTLSSPPLNCAGVQTAVARIGDACKACHDDYRR